MYLFAFCSTNNVFSRMYILQSYWDLDLQDSWSQWFDGGERRKINSMARSHREMVNEISRGSLRQELTKLAINNPYRHRDERRTCAADLRSACPDADTGPDTLLWSYTTRNWSLWSKLRFAGRNQTILKRAPRPERGEAKMLNMQWSTDCTRGAPLPIRQVVARRP